MNEFQHCYSKYIGHILNKSPSKTTYSFAKAERFPAQKAEEPASYSHLDHAACHCQNGQDHSCGKASPTLDPWTQSRGDQGRVQRTNPNYGVTWEVDRILRNI